jgi:hypothetical protein
MRCGSAEDRRHRARRRCRRMTGLRDRRLHHQLVMRCRTRCRRLRRRTRRAPARFPAGLLTRGTGMRRRMPHRRAVSTRMRCRMAPGVPGRRRLATVYVGCVGLRVRRALAAMHTMRRCPASVPPCALRCMPLPIVFARLRHAPVRLRRPRRHRALPGSHCRRRHPHRRKHHHRHFPHVASECLSCLSFIGRRLYPTRTCNNPHMD